MPNPHLTATGTPWRGSSTPTVTRPSSMPPMLGWTGGRGQGSGSATTNVVDTRGNGNDGRGDGQVTGITSVDDMIEDPITVDEISTHTIDPINPTNLDDRIWELATQAYLSNPGYALSYEGKEYAKDLAKSGITKGDPRYEQAMIQAFGLPQIVTTSSRAYGKPILTTEGDKPIMTGLGQTLLDQYDSPTGSYQEQADKYYADREAEEAQQPDKDPNYGYGYGYGSGTSYAGSFSYPGFPQVASAHRMHQGWLDTLYKGRTQPGQEVQKMLASNQKIEAANILSRLSQDAQAFEMDPKRRGILAMLQA